MKVLFRSPETWPRDEGRPALFLEARVAAHAGNVSQAVADAGADGLISTGDDPEVLYAPDTPVFDDLLAIWLLLHAGEMDPRLVAALCDHARLLRLGHTPGRVAPEESPDAILDEIRRRHRDLSSPAESGALLERAYALFDHVAARLDAGSEVAGADLFDGAAEWQEEKNLLLHDRDLYIEDRRRGQQWIAAVEHDGVRREADLLLLESPASTRYRDWARRDADAPFGTGYALLLVRWDDGRWILSADPVKRLSIAPVATALQRAEDRKGGDASEGWYDGERHRGALVASPWGGTRLSRDEILGVVRRELNLRRPGRNRHYVPIAAALLIVALAIGGWLLTRDGAEEPTAPQPPVAHGRRPTGEELARGVMLTSEGSDEPERIGLYGKVHVLIIGIDDYADELMNLKYAVHDAKGVREILEARFAIDSVIDLYDSDATRTRILETLGELELGRDDALFVFWAGHGTTVKTAKGEPLGYLVPHDGSMGSKGEMLALNISMNEIRSVMEGLGAKHRFLVVDTCYGGILTVRGTDQAPEANGDYLRSITREETFQILTAGKADQTVLDGGPGGHSVFTGHFIEALRRAEGFATASTLGVEVRQRVFEAAKARHHRQVPDFGRVSGRGDFVFLRKPAEPAVPDED